MKRKFILLPITLTALSPMAGLVSCNEPEPKTEIIELNNIATSDYGEQLESDLLLLDTNTTYKLTADYSKTRKTIFSDIALYDGDSNWYDMCVTPLEFRINQIKLQPSYGFECDDNNFCLRSYGVKGIHHIEIVFLCSAQTNNSKLEFSFKFWAPPAKKVKFILYDKIS